MPRILWAIDPGAARNGLSIWDLDTGEHYGKYILSYDEMLGMLDRLSDDMGVEEIVVEDYIIAPGKNSGSRGETIKVIANVEAANRRLGRRILLTKQRPGILRTTAKMAGVRL